MPHFYIEMLKILYYIISDHSKRKDQKFYLKHYPRKRLLTMHDFTPKEKKMREEVKNIKNVRDANYKVFLFHLYRDKREDRRRREEDGYTGYSSSSDSNSD